MPKIAEIREINGDVWVRVGKPGEFENGIAIWTPEEAQKHYDSGYKDGYDARADGEEYKR